MTSILAALLSLTGALWTTSGYEGFAGEKPEFDHVAVSHDGVVALAPRLEPAASLDESSVWSIAEAPGRRVFIGTGSSGRVYLMESGAAPRAVFSAEAGEVLCLTADRRGNVFFGTTPEATVYRIGPAAVPELLAATGEQYVFDLVAGPDGELYCATGINGRLYRILPTGKAEVIFTAPQSHLTCLAWLVEGRELLVGTAPEGIVYRLKLPPAIENRQSRIGNLQASVLYDTRLEEIRCLAAGPSLVHIGANPGEDGNDSGPAVLCVDTDGILRWQWTCPESTVFDILPLSGPRPLTPGPGLLVATGSDGIVYELDSLGRPSLFQKTADLRVVCLAAGRQDVWLGTANATRVYAMKPDLSASGFLLSEPHDCAGPARFGRIQYRAAVPHGTGLALDTRSGNSEKPDSTWSAWREAGETVRSPVARFIQWRCRLSTGFPKLTPRLEQVDVYYRIPNRAPRIGKLEVSALSWADAREGKADPQRDVTWEALDPDSDSLSFRLLFQGESARWHDLAEDLAGASKEIDTRTLADGWYRFKLVATDKPSQPPDAALTAEFVSRPVLVDNTPPRLAGISASGGRLTFSVADEASAIAGCRYSVNAGPWQQLEPADGIFDSREERFETRVELAPGENTVAVWAADAQGNTTTQSRLIGR